MIFAEAKPLSEILEALRGYRRVLLVGCATCVAECAAGGEREVETLAPLLHLASAQQGAPLEISATTLERQCEREFHEELVPLLPEVEALVSLACGIGVQALAESFPHLPVYPGVNTSALTVREEPGLWAARCSACGDCQLGETFGICPITRCAKSIMNGPCGGTREEGKCEIDENLDCAWYLIYTRATERGQVEQLTQIKRPKNWAGSQHGGPKKVLREDLRP